MVKSDASPQALGLSDYPPAKRKRFDDQEPHSSQKKARTRVSYSCGECHRRKQKCDRQMPCSHCIARKVPELCKAYTPGKSEQDIHLRLARLEHIVEIALPQYAEPNLPGSSPMEYKTSSIRRRSGTATPDEDSASQLEDVDILISAGTFQSGNWYGNSASGSIAPAPVLDQLQQVGQSKASASEAEVSTQNGLPVRFGEYLNDISARQGTEPSAVEKLQSLIQDCGVSPSQLTDLLNDLPPRKVADQLVDYYFESLNWTRYPISELEFRTSYRSICTNGILANPSDIRFIPLLFVVLAITVRLAPEHISGQSAHSKRISSLRCYWSSRRALLIAAAIQTDSLEMVLTRLLSARFLTFDRRITECWSQLGAAVCTAQALGLHRDGAAMASLLDFLHPGILFTDTIKGMSPTQAEYRRRIWAYLYHADRSYALVLGRPNAIHDEYTSTLPPLNMEELPSSNCRALPLAPPLSIPSRMTYVILRHTLGSIIGRMVHHFQQIRSSHYSEVLALDDDLQRFIDTLPPHFALHPDRSLDVSHEYIAVHRFLLITEILFVRISMHRPYLLRRLGSDRYSPSRRTCFQSAMLDFEVRRAFRMTIRKEQLDAMSNAYREFQTAMVAGIYLVLEPQGKDVPMMHSILDAFLKDHEGVQELQSTTRREIKIIEFLKSKTTLPDYRSADCYDHAEISSPGEQSMDIQANLLLSLQQSRGAATTAPVSRQRTQQEGPLNSVLHGPSGRLPFLTLAMGNPATPQTPPAVNSPSLQHKPRSPTFQRVVKADSYNIQSPLGSGSPGVEEEPSSTAQSLLDQWYNAVSNYPPSDTLSVEGTGNSGYWINSNGTIAGDSAWANGSMPFLAGGDIVGVEGADWNLWENLVNQIRGGP